MYKRQEVIDATQTVYEQNNHTVSLSAPLKELEAQLNQIKMSVLLSKQAAKQAEEKKNEIIMYLAPVSYTHLDVYKRQIFHFTVKIVGRSKGKSVISASAYLNGDVMKKRSQVRLGLCTVCSARRRDNRWR